MKTVKPRFERALDFTKPCQKLTDFNIQTSKKQSPTKCLGTVLQGANLPLGMEKMNLKRAVAHICTTSSMSLCD